MPVSTLSTGAADSLTQKRALALFVELFCLDHDVYAANDGCWWLIDTTEPDWWTKLPDWCSRLPPTGLLQQHLSQHLTFGTVASRPYPFWPTPWLNLDLDLHEGNLQVYLEMARILIRRFHGNGWHHDVGQHGLHLVNVFGPNTDQDPTIAGHWKRRYLGHARGQLRAALIELARQHPALEERARSAGMKGFTDLEIYPAYRHACRIPLGKDRWLWTDDLNQLRETRAGNWVADVRAYVEWLLDPERQYAAADDVFGFLLDVSRVRAKPGPRSPAGQVLLPRTHQAIPGTASPSTTEAVGAQLGLRLQRPDGQGGDGDSRPADAGLSSAVPTTATVASISPKRESTQPLGTMRGRFGYTLARLALGQLPAADNILTTCCRMWFRLLHADGRAEAEAVEVVLREMKTIPNTSFSSCLDNERWSVVSRKVRRQARIIWRTKNRQVAEPAKSLQILKKAAAHWRNTGLDITSLQAFAARYGKEGRNTSAVIMCSLCPTKLPALTEDESARIAQFARTMKIDPDEAAKIVVSLLVRVRDGQNELCLRQLPHLLAGFKIKLAKHAKQTLFKKTLVDLGFLTISAKHWKDHRGTSYTAGLVGRRILDRLQVPAAELDEDVREGLQTLQEAAEEAG